MKIAILPMMVGRNAGGMETYERGLVGALTRIDRKNEYIVYAVSRESVEVLKSDLSNFRIRLLRPSARVISLTTTLPILLTQDRPDLLHATSFPPPFAPRRLVFTLACLSHLKYSHLYPRLFRLRVDALTRVGMRRAKIIICVSESTRQHAIEEFRVSPDRLCVIHLGVDDCFSPVEITSEVRGRLASSYGIRGRYFLFVGRFEARKNVVGLVEAFSLYRKLAGGDGQLVLAGRQDWPSHGIDESIAQLGLAGEVVRTGHIPREDLPTLYSAAEALVMPSWWEGFGLPPLEAMACGTPAIVANNSAMPEVTQGSALLVDASDPGQIAEAMHRVATDQCLRAELRARGLARASQFSWDHVARQTLAVYERACL